MTIKILGVEVNKTLFVLSLVVVALLLASIVGVNLYRFFHSSKNLFAKANQMFDYGDFSGAIELYKQLTNDKELGVKATYNLGEAYFKLEDYEEAAKVWSQIPTNATEYEWALYNRGVANYELKRIDKAIDDFREALKLNPWDEGARNNFFVLKLLKSSGGGGGKKRNQSEQEQRRYLSLEELLKYITEKEKNTMEKESRRGVPKKWYKDW